MTWYLYTGSRVQSVATGHGNSVAVPPYGKVEIHQLVPSTESMVKRGILRPCGRPVAVKTGVHPVVVAGGAEALQKTKFAGYFQERGVTHDPTMAPVKAGGAVEEQPLGSEENVIEAPSSDTVK
jgi:hypothetical protein